MQWTIVDRFGGETSISCYQFLEAYPHVRLYLGIPFCFKKTHGMRLWLLIYIPEHFPLLLIKMSELVTSYLPVPLLTVSLCPYQLKLSKRSGRSNLQLVILSWMLILLTSGHMSGERPNMPQINITSSVLESWILMMLLSGFGRPCVCPRSNSSAGFCYLID